MTERVDETGLSLAIGLITRSVTGIRTGKTCSLEDTVHIVDPDHHLTRWVRRPLVDPEFTHDQLGPLTIEAKLNPVALTDAYVLDQPQDADVPRGRNLHIVNGEHRNDPRPRR